ncbi:MAG: NAD+ kinase [Leptospiraceae bacterium]|nr:NAD+ kinase [Leptospiraceae bacterium]
MNQVLIVQKRTKFELDQIIYPDQEFYKKITQIQNNSYDRIYNSHIRQLESREILRKIFPKGKFIFRDELDKLNLQDFDLVIALGGDNHFTYVAHYTKGTKILGCNSDTKTSLGALLAFDPNSLEQVVKDDFKETKIEEWSLISARIEYPNGGYLETVSSVNEVSVRNASPDLTSRYIICKDDEREEQKSSGLLLYTGAGSTGWLTACLGNTKSSLGEFPKNANEFRVFTRELSRKARKNYKLTNFVALDSISIISEMNGGISIDCLPERIYPFPPGAIATFYLSPQKLRVVVKK